MRIRSSRDSDDSFTAFVADRSGRLIAQAELLCGNQDQARDIVQNTLVRAYVRWRHIEHDDPYGYLHRAVANAVTDHWRSARRRYERSMDELPDVPVPDDTTIEDRRTLFAALEHLTPRERAVVVLRHLDDHPERDVADMLDVSIGTVKSTCSRALRKLRVILDDDADHSPSSPPNEPISDRSTGAY